MVKCLLSIVFLLLSVRNICSHTPEQLNCELPFLGLLGIFASVPSAALLVRIQRLRSDIRDCEHEKENLGFEVCEKALTQKRTEVEEAEADLKKCECGYDNFYEFLDKLCDVYRFKECDCSSINSEEECNSTGYCEWGDCGTCD
ncbi:uncharacterized protein LOC133202766 [Saccostrea echinata]|uniref:uncharacterized protein LOC133202766 n=1 Tax=Saccostrea echinata TaxID=191078 RepID=UPI002A8294FB|nr:uncharacterized protein LOC133202766 [Saccostrea echinata]